ncbi:endoplasmic reticulum aminopeptidase 1-like [Sinocyclocheilus grahami]|uniref:endoplasmic reticulum aminopeptidase 1-like n=1 Tax=Sinocyclocheilus grahami TaxID=75366 RepID=UPI0007ACF65E|nr:PREDICTED: endoplasmic reticulum aminopeptidase 1-like [Sinocyclocheilus grahami]
MTRFVLLVNLIVLPVHLWAAVTQEHTSFPTSVNGEPFPWNKMRLPDTVSPLHYHLLVHPNLTSLDFTGWVQIQIEVHENTRTIILHSKDLHISNARLLGSDKGQLQALKVLEYPYFQQIALISDNALLKRGHVYSVELEFAANLSESFHGFYKSTYRSNKGDVRVVASTQFEPTSARAAFPCFDEPDFKANFSIRIRREAKHIALSNMPKLRTLELPDGLFEDQFDVSVKMSTYLVAFIVSDFLSISKMSLHGVQISVYAVPEKIDQAEFALDAAVKLLDFYDDYFDIPYPLPKQDLAAIPDFQSGAMENWGLTTYRESALLFDPHKSSASDKLGITMIIAHELAHQWFGNLVTMQWWNDLWLNEGFAKFMEFVSVNITNPELQVEDYFLGKCFEAMEVDSLSSSHPVSTPVENPAQIQEMFDDVSYDKGACILNMLREFLTPDAFKLGIVRYLKRYSYQNTVNSNLWESLTNVCDSDGLDEGRMKGDESCRRSVSHSGASKWHSEDELDVKAMMETWTLQEGFPLITVEVRGREVRLSQERYLKSDDPSQTSRVYAVENVLAIEIALYIPLPKQDLAAIPDFQSGAMENWGLTTYRESALLFDPHKSSASDKLGITMIIAHELAHQWFGNLVTMQWWNDLWLNEGFAKFMEFVSVNITNPELQVEDYFLGKCFEAMEVDSLSSSHPVSTPVENPAQIQEMFDDVSYDKGACILNMLREFLTPDAFKLGIVRYLKRYSYQNTVNSNLWESLTNVCDSDGLDEGRMKGDESCRRSVSHSGASKWHSEDELDVKAMMETWTLQEGFPLITVEVRGREVRLSQERYLKSDDPSQTSSFLWHVPLTYITSGSTTVQRFLLKTKTDVLYLPEEVDWIKFNVDMSGYYIVHYEGSGWDDLITLLKHNHTALSSNDRASLINNAFQLVSVGKLPLDKALDLTLYLSKETEIMPVTQGFSELVPLYKLMEKRDMVELENQMKGYILQLFRKLIDQQSWTDDGSVSQRMLRSYLLMFGCVRGHPPCVSTATHLFNQWRDSDGNMSLPNDVTMAVFSVGARTEDGWEFLFEKYKESMYVSMKNRIKMALTTSPLDHKLKWMIEQSLVGEVMKTQDLPYVVTSVSKNPKAYKHAWDFLKANWDALIKKFDLGSHSIAHMVVGVTNQYSTREMLAEVRRFFSSLRAETGAELRCILQALENIEENIRWMDKNLPLLKAWLHRQYDQHKNTEL